MEDQLAALDNCLRTLRPEFYSALNEPVSEAEVQTLEAKFNTKLPEDLKLLYRWKNGQDQACYDVFVNNSVFLPLEEALDITSELTTMIGLDFEIENWWNENWIPIFNNGGGDLICYDCQGIFTGNAGQLIEFWHADNDRNVIAPNLESFIAAINHFYKTTGDDKDFEEYRPEDIKISIKRFYLESKKG